MPKFPKTIYVKYEDGGSGPPYLACSDTVSAMADVGEQVKIGVYELTEMGEAIGVVNATILPLKKRR